MTELWQQSVLGGCEGNSRFESLMVDGGHLMDASAVQFSELESLEVKAPLFLMITSVKCTLY